jgi:hypothetical protein
LRAFILVLVFFVVPTAHSHVITWNNKKFHIDYSKDWQTAQNFFGVPITLFGPMTAKNIRPVIQIIPSEAKALELSESELKVFNQKYPLEKKNWLKARNGQFLSFLPAGLESFGKDQKAIVAGLAYRLGDHSYTEKTFYLNCAKKVVQLKLLAPMGEIKSFEETEKVLRSFRCD